MSRSSRRKSPATPAAKNVSTATAIAAARAAIRDTLWQVAPWAARVLLQQFDQVAKTARRTEIVQDRFLRAVPAVLATLAAEPDDGEVFPARTDTVVLAENQLRLQNDLAAAFARVHLQASLQPEEKLKILRGMLRTRHLDARLKKLFVGSEVILPDGTPFQGKGFRSMGQEAIYAAGIRLRRHTADAPGDFVAPMIRDLGLALAMGIKPYDVMAAQMGKPGVPTQGKDLHIGDFAIGVLPPAAPIALSTGTVVGLGLALQDTGRVVVNCNGEGGTSAGEWHEAVNFAAVRKLPIVFVVQNNQTALATPVAEQLMASTLAAKAIGYGMRAIAVDGTDPEAVFAAVTEAAEACRRGDGPVLVELVCMRMCGHAHHDDMLYFGHEPEQFLEYPELAAPSEAGYVDRDKYTYWRQKDPIATYKQKLLAAGILDDDAYERMVQEASAEMETAAQQVIAALWPKSELAGGPVVCDGERATHEEPLHGRAAPFPKIPDWQPRETVGFVADTGGKTFWQAIVEALVEELRRDPAVFILGEDVGGKYGNAFVILKSLLEAFGDRLLNTPLSESAIIGAATGAALLGKRPVAEIQFNDFIASGFNQLVNNTAKIFYRWAQPVPVTIRLPWGGLRQAGPYHSQNTEPWFYRTPGLKIVCPSTPREAKALLKAAIRDDNPVLYYEHIALYRAATIKQQLPDEAADFVLPIGAAHLKRNGSDLTLITYGAYVHRCLAVAERLAQEDGVDCQVLDLRTLAPLDRPAVLACVAKTGRVLIVHEDSKTGGIGQSVAALIAEEAFEYLDAPVRVLGALDTPVPYSPTLEAAFLVSHEQILTAARLLARY